ncbi:pyridoxal phosphate-dependent aminotransferase [Urechidicola sp. KH5]
MKQRSKLPYIGTTIFTTMSQMAAEYQAINLSQGFPDFACDPVLIDLVTKAMKQQYNQYAPMPGVLALREAVAQKIEACYGAQYHPETEVTITAGASQAIYTTISTFIQPGDEVLLFKPAFDIYEPAITVAGGTPIAIQLDAPNYTIDWEVVKVNISAKTKMIIINTPQNPTGSILTAADMQILEALTENTDILVLSDEVYEHIIFDGHQHESASTYAGLKERSIVTASFGKTFHVTGWKMGYCVAPASLMAEIRKVHQYDVFCVHHPTQIALAEYLKEPSHYEQLNAFYQEKRDLFLDSIKGSRFRFTPSAGTYFQNLDYTAISDEHDVAFAKRLVEEFRLATIPISVFNVDGRSDGLLRFCFAKKEDTLRRAAEVLNRI